MIVDFLRKLYAKRKQSPDPVLRVGYGLAEESRRNPRVAPWRERLVREFGYPETEFDKMWAAYSLSLQRGSNILAGSPGPDRVASDWNRDLEPMLRALAPDAEIKQARTDFDLAVYHRILLRAATELRAVQGGAADGEEPVRARPAGDDPRRFAFPFEALRDVIASGRKDAIVGDRSIVLPWPAGNTEVTMEFVGPAEKGGPLRERIRVRTKFAKGSDAATDDALLAALNRFAGLSSLTADAESGALVGGAAIYFRPDDESLARSVYVPVLAFEALGQAEFVPAIIRHAAAAAQGRRSEDAAHRVPEAELPSRWTEADFRSCAERAGSHGLASSFDTSGLAIKVPLDGGAGTAKVGDKATALVIVRNDAPHPCLGRGALLLLQLPWRMEPAEGASLVHRWNRIECEEAQAFPHFGAWTVDPQLKRLAFTAFLPNLLYKPHLLDVFVTMLVARARAARGWLERFNVHGNASLGGDEPV